MKAITAFLGKKGKGEECKLSSLTEKFVGPYLWGLSLSALPALNPSVLLL